MYTSITQRESHHLSIPNAKSLKHVTLSTYGDFTHSCASCIRFRPLNTTCIHNILHTGYRKPPKSQLVFLILGMKAAPGVVLSIEWDTVSIQPNFSWIFPPRVLHDYLTKFLALWKFKLIERALSLPKRYSAIDYLAHLWHPCPLWNHSVCLYTPTQFVLTCTDIAFCRPSELPCRHALHSTPHNIGPLKPRMVSENRFSTSR